MAWRTCVPFLRHSTREYVRGPGQRDVVRDPNFYVLELDLLAEQVGGKKLHVEGRIFSADEISQVEDQSNYRRLTTISSNLVVYDESR